MATTTYTAWGEGDFKIMQHQNQNWSPSHTSSGTNPVIQNPIFPNPFIPDPLLDPNPSYVSRITAKKDAALIKADIDKLATLLEEMEDDVSEQNRSLMNDAIFFLREALEMMDKFTDE